MSQMFYNATSFNQDISQWNWNLQNKNTHKMLIGTKREKTDASFDFTTGKPILDDTIYSNIDRDNFVSYLNAFIADAKRHGLDLSYINTSYYNHKLDDLKGNIAGLSQTCGHGINITIDKRHWEKGQKDDEFHLLLHTIYHELRHTILGLQHLCQNKHIMSASYDPN